MLRLYNTMLHLLRLDQLCKHLQVVGPFLTHSTCHMMLTSADLELCQPKRSIFQCVYRVLKYSELEFQKIYMDLPNQPLSKIPNGPHLYGHDLYEAAGMVKLVKQSVIGGEGRQEEREGDLALRVLSGQGLEEQKTSTSGGEISHYKRYVDVGLLVSILYVMQKCNDS